VIAFGEKALRLQDSLHKGQEVEVVGYVHVQERPDRRTGEVKEQREVWAAVVKKPRVKAG